MERIRKEEGEKYPNGHISSIRVQFANLNSLTFNHHNSHFQPFHSTGILHFGLRRPLPHSKELPRMIHSNEVQMKSQCPPVALQQIHRALSVRPLPLVPTIQLPIHCNRTILPAVHWAQRNEDDVENRETRDQPEYFGNF